MSVEVAVIGGSLCGLTFALACANRGIHTTVLERGHGQHQSGSALGIDRSLLLRVVGNNPHDEAEMAPIPVITGYRNAVSWQVLHGWLRDLARRRSEITLQDETSVCEVVQSPTNATAITTDGRRIDAAVIVGADGYRSIVRGAIDPEQPHALYAGYLLWRGLVREINLPPDTAWPQGDDGDAFVTDTGYRLIAYPVAEPNSSLQPGERLISFAWYDATRGALLRELGCLSDNGHVLASLTHVSVPARICDELCDLARRIWPEPWCAFVIHALERREVFATPIAEYFPQRLYSGRLAMIGDAAHVVSPKTGGGFVAGMWDAHALAECLEHALDQGGDSIFLALENYEARRLAAAQKLARASIQWSRRYVQDTRKSLG